MEYVKLATVHDFKRTNIKSFKLLARPVGIIKQTCPWHGWRYNLVTGECLWGSGVCLRRHGLKIEGDDIYVTLRPLEPETSIEDDWGPPLR